MKLIIYLYKKFMGVFIGALCFFVLVLCLTDLLINIWNYISQQVPVKVVGSILIYYIPKCVWYAIPIAMLFATAYTLSDLYAKNELVAVFASGVSLLKFTIPLLIFAIILSFGLFEFEDNIVVPTYAKKEELTDMALHKEKSLNNDRIVIMSNAGQVIYKAEHYDDKQEKLYNLYIVIRDENKSLISIIKSESAKWDNDHWSLYNPIEYREKDETIKIVQFNKNVQNILTEPPATFQNNTINVESVNTKEARQYIEHLQKSGLPSAEASSIYYKKYAFPFIVFLVVFLAIGLSGKTQKNVLLISLALSISAVVLFYVMQMVTMLMAKFGAIPPLFGAWFPVFFFIVVSIVLLKFART